MPGSVQVYGSNLRSEVRWFRRVQWFQSEPNEGSTYAWFKYSFCRDLRYRGTFGYRGSYPKDARVRLLSGSGQVNASKFHFIAI